MRKMENLYILDSRTGRFRLSDPTYLAQTGRYKGFPKRSFDQTAGQSNWVLAKDFKIFKQKSKFSEISKFSKKFKIFKKNSTNFDQTVGQSDWVLAKASWLASSLEREKQLLKSHWHLSLLQIRQGTLYQSPSYFGKLLRCGHETLRNN